MKRILFVDDEPKVLEGLRRMLRPLRLEWDMEFAPSGPDALRVMEGGPFDVLVTDMRMPVMDGTQLLGVVRERYPRTVRIVLTGQTDREGVLRSVSLAHRMLMKPCDTEALKATVARACALQDLLHSEALLKVTSRLSSIPSLPALYLEVVRELEAREPSLQKVGQIVARDAGMAAKFLQVVNSAFFGLRGRISNPSQAVLLLGAETTKALVLATNVFCRYDPSALKPFSLDALWAHSQLTGELARCIANAEQANAQIVQDAALAGLLHDMGKLIFAAHMPEAYRDVLALAAREGRPLWEVERAVLGATHADVGAYVLGLWGIPDPVVEAVAWHHRPSDCPAAFGPLTAVHVANTLANEGEETRPEVPLDIAYLEQLGLAHRLEEWRGLLRTLTTGCNS